MLRAFLVAVLAGAATLVLSCGDDDSGSDRDFCLEGRECTSCEVGGDCEAFDLGCGAGQEQICVGADYFGFESEAGRCVLCVEE